MPGTATSALLDSAFARHQAGDLVEATRLYKEILACDTRNPDALHMMGVIARQKGNDALALKLIETALGQRTTMPLAWHNRSLILRVAGREDEALQSAMQAVDLDPNFAEAWDMIGLLKRERDDYEGSRDAHGRAVALRPDDLKFLSNYALLLYATGDLAEAYKIMRDVEKRDPDLAPQTMGNILKAAGYTERALPYYRRSCELLPENDELRATAAMAHLQIGNFAEGWKIWETRPSLDQRFGHLPFWQGQQVEHLLVHEDQGIGDAFQCARYIPDLRRYTKRITLQVAQSLHRLLAASFPECDVITLDDPVPNAGARIRMLSLPAFFHSYETNILTKMPYLRVKDSWQQHWRTSLMAIGKPRIGLVWGGNPEHLNDSMRSIPFAQLGLILQVANGHMISLQKGAQKTGADLAASGLCDADLFLHDFADTADLMSELDLVLCVDTSVAHLAGALGKPVWLMLPYDADWRWLIGREDSPWYPTMRLFRQAKPREWQPVISRVAAELGRFMSGDAAVLQPVKWQAAALRENLLASSVLTL